jgi:uncharacterized membrane protein YoaK (UPF0700 family)
MADSIAGASAQRAAADVRHPLALSLLTLTFTTGLVDSASYLGLGHVFTANMTGNVVLLGFGLAGAGHLPVLAPIVSLLAFLAGATLGGLLVRRAGHLQPGHVVGALTLEAMGIAAAAVIALTRTATPGGLTADIIIALLALAMGLRNATIRRIAVPDLTTTVLTMTITGLAADSPLAGGSGRGSVRRVSAIVALAAGAVAGALLLKISLGVVLACAAALALVTAAAYSRSDEAATAG